MLDEDNQLGDKVKSKYKDMEELEKQEQSRQERISKAEKDLADAELELHNLPRYEPPKEKIEKLTTEILDLEQSAKQKRYQTKDKEKLLDRYRVSVRQGAERLKEMDSTKNKRFNTLRNSGAHTINDAYCTSP
ncbi:structural maintenance of chromosomes protein 5 [Tanacetum coccineum]